jgi:hypothetical protein
MSDRSGNSRLVLEMGLSSAMLASIVAAIIFTLLSAVPPLVDTHAPSTWDLAKTIVLLLPITAASCGSFGALAGILGGVFLVLRRSHIHSTGRLMVESAIAGFVLGFGFPFFDRILNRFTNNWAILSAPAGMLCSVICAAIFRRQLISHGSHA